MTYADVVYMILDELKLSSDDSYFNEYHVLMLADKYRAMILKQRYKDIKKTVPYSNYQEVMFTLNKRSDSEKTFKDLRSAVDNPNNFNYIQGTPLETNYYFSGDGTKEIINYVDEDGNGEKILKRGFPMLIGIGNPSVYLDDYNHTMINLVSREHGRYVGNNKYLRNILYAFIEPNKGLYVKIPDTFKFVNTTEPDGSIDNPILIERPVGTFKFDNKTGRKYYYATEDIVPSFEVDKYYVMRSSPASAKKGTLLFKCTKVTGNNETFVAILDFINSEINDLEKFRDVTDNIPIKMVAIFEDSVYASEFTVEKELHPLERTFPMEDSLVNLVIEAVVKELTYPVYRKEDTENNGTDTMPENQAVAPNNRR